MRQQIAREPSGRVSIIGRDPYRSCHTFGAVRAIQFRAQHQRISLGCRECGKRRMARATKRGEQRALRHHRRVGRGVVDRRHEAVQPRVVAPDFDPDGTLRWGGQHRLNRHRRSCRMQPQSVEPRRCEQRRIKRAAVNFGKPCGDIAAQQGDLQVWAQPEQLRAPPWRACANQRPLFECHNMRATDKPITDISAGQHRGQGKVRWAKRLDVLHRVHGKVDLATSQRMVELFGPQRFAPHFGKRPVLNFVA